MSNYEVNIKLLGEEYLNINIETNKTKEEIEFYFIGIFRTLIVGINYNAKKSKKTYAEELINVVSNEKYIKDFINSSISMIDEIISASKKLEYLSDEKEIYDITVEETIIPNTVEELFNH